MPANLLRRPLVGGLSASRSAQKPPLSLLALDVDEQGAENVDQVSGSGNGLLVAGPVNQVPLLPNAPVGPCDVGLGAGDILLQTRGRSLSADTSSCCERGERL